MKNQYFGDIRDLFKYDLIQHIVVESKILERCVWVPMLTENDERSQGEKRSDPKAGYHNRELNAFLDNYKDKGRSERNISHLHDVRFFREPRVLVFSLEPRSSCDYLPDFDHSSRRTYFAEVERALRPNSLLFLDPDTGIGPDSRPSERHVLLREIADLHSAMDARSVLMIYQHHHHKQRPEFFRYVSQRIVQQPHLQPPYVSDNEIAFFFLSKATDVRRELSGLLRGYAAEYSPRISAGPER